VSGEPVHQINGRWINSGGSFRQIYPPVAETVIASAYRIGTEPVAGASIYFSQPDQLTKYILTAGGDWTR
jgi:hypothetical protein